MVVTRIGPEHNLKIPDAFRDMFPAGEEVAISADAQGRLIVTPVEKIRELLSETFGMWSDRTDLPGDGVDYMDEIRYGQRLNRFASPLDETH